MKILVFNYEYPPVGGGGGRLCQKVSEAMVERGHSVRVVTAGVGDLARDAVEGGVRVLRPRSFRRREDTCSVLEMGNYIATAFYEALSQARHWHPDVIHAHFVVPTGVLAWGVSRLSGVPYVVTAHLGDVPGGVPEQTKGLFRLAKPLARRIWAGAAVRTAISGHVAGLAREAFDLEADRVILNGIPPVPRPVLAPPGVPEILMVGRLSVQKNPLLAVEALAGLPRELAWKLSVIGMGPLEAEMRESVGKAGLGGRVEFCGWLGEAAVRERMAQAQILLMPSLHEGLPMAAVEALWHGLAIVGSRIGGLRDVVPRGKNGSLCPLEAGAFTSALAGLLGEPSALSAARSASLELAREFDFARTADLYESALRDAARQS